MLEFPHFPDTPCISPGIDTVCLDKRVARDAISRRFD
jgi:hypothetical protein